MGHQRSGEKTFLRSQGSYRKRVGYRQKTTRSANTIRHQFVGKQKTGRTNRCVDETRKERRSRIHQDRSSPTERYEQSPSRSHGPGTTRTHHPALRHPQYPIRHRTGRQRCGGQCGSDNGRHGNGIAERRSPTLGTGQEVQSDRLRPRRENHGGGFPRLSRKRRTASTCPHQLLPRRGTQIRLRRNHASYGSQRSLRLRYRTVARQRRTDVPLQSG